MTSTTSPPSILSTTCGDPSPSLLSVSTGIPIRAIAPAVPRVATMENPRSCSWAAIAPTASLSESVTVRNTVPACGSRAPAAACALAKAAGKSGATPITSPVDRISGPSSASAPAKRSNGSTASLTDTWSGGWDSLPAGRSRSASRSPSITRQATLASGMPVALDTNGTVRDARGFASITYSASPSTAYWTFISPTTPSSSASAAVDSRISRSISLPSECGGSTQAESPEWMPASSTCCMIPPIHTSSPSQIASTSTSMAFSRKRSRKVARAHQQREADLGSGGQRLVARVRGGVRRRLQAELLEERAEAPAVLGEVDRLRLGPEQRHAGGFQTGRELQRRLAAELHDHALGLLDFDDPEHVVERQRLEVQPVARVVVGRDGLRVAVDHHRVAARLAHGQRGVHAAVVELDPLADPVRAGAEDHHARLVAAHHLVAGRVALPGGVVVRRLGLELGGAGVHRAVGPGARPGALAGEQGQLAQVPRVDPGARPDLLRADAAGEQLEDHVIALRAGRLQRVEQLVAVDAAGGRRVQLARAHRLRERLPEGPPDGHHLADRLHVGGELRVDARELLEREARPLDDHVVERGLERGRRAARDVVGDLVEPVADRQPRRDLRDREPGRLGGQGARARHARIHLDDDDLLRHRVDRELDVGAARLDPDRADHGDRLVAELLVEPVAERLLGRDGHGVTRVHAHRVDVLDRADDHDVVRAVAHHLELELAPAEHRLVDQ